MRASQRDGTMPSALQNFKNTKGKPTVIIANTLKGKGVPFMELKSACHGKAPNKEQLAEALNLQKQSTEKICGRTCCALGRIPTSARMCGSGRYSSTWTTPPTCPWACASW
jgi:deoxyxylulose-5-phosphate synthase